MTNFESKILSNRKISFEKLLSFGFTEEKNRYTYRSALLNNQFDIIIEITQSGELKTKIVDAQTKDEYTLIHVRSASGEFVGKVREEYEALLNTIIEKCTSKEVFKSNDAKKIIQYIQEKYNDEPEFLWTKFPTNAIFRNKENAKWYAALLNLPKHKIGLEGEGNIDILDLRSDPTSILSLVDGKKILPGYHMSKKSWFTIPLNESIPIKEIYSYIDLSYQIIKNK